MIEYNCSSSIIMNVGTLWWWRNAITKVVLLLASLNPFSLLQQCSQSFFPNPFDPNKINFALIKTLVVELVNDKDSFMLENLDTKKGMLGDTASLKRKQMVAQNK